MSLKWLRSHCALLTALSMLVIAATAWGQGITALAPAEESESTEPKRNDGWTERDDQPGGGRIMSWEMTVHPRDEPLPSLKYRFLPNAYQRLGGNAAIYYLKAQGFLEQGSARKRLTEVQAQAAEQARKENKDYDQVPPEVWRLTPPGELPLDEVKNYLSLTSFQPQFLREASLRDQFDLDRNLRDVADPIAYLLPEIQDMRSMARLQDLRCRVAIAEGRLDDAVEILGQQYAMARHLGQDEFLVSNLVGIACAGIALPQALHLAQHPDAPNLYWAYSTLPHPLVSRRRSMALEHGLLYEQLKVLREVDERPRPAGYWSDFIDRAIDQFGCLGYELGFKDSLKDKNKNLKRAAVVAYVMASYPGARRYLIHTWQMDPQQVEEYPTAQVVFLALVRFYDQWSDNMLKWSSLPYWQSRDGMDRVSSDMRKAADELGFSSAGAMLLLPAVMAVEAAEARCQQQLALLQTVEGIRMYGARNNGELPKSLADLPVPAPIDPVTGQTIAYEVVGRRAILRGARLPGIRYELVVQFAR